MKNITYRGLREPDVGGPGSVTILLNGMEIGPLPSRREIHNHSPDGFQWGYMGSGPAQLALALCVDALMEREDPFPVERARYTYQWVKESLIAPLKNDMWEMGLPEVLAAIDEAENERGALELTACPFHGVTHPSSGMCPICIEDEKTPFSDDD